jgi:hypothetical protein
VTPLHPDRYRILGFYYSSAIGAGTSALLGLAQDKLAGSRTGCYCINILPAVCCPLYKANAAVMAKAIANGVDGASAGMMLHPVYEPSWLLIDAKAAVFALGNCTKRAGSNKTLPKHGDT